MWSASRSSLASPPFGFSVLYLYLQGEYSKRILKFVPSACVYEKSMVPFKILNHLSFVEVIHVEPTGLASSPGPTVAAAWVSRGRCLFFLNLVPRASDPSWEGTKGSGIIGHWKSI